VSDEMQILYSDPYRDPNNGDVKTLKNGDKFIRKQQMHDGMYVVCSGKPVYDWYRYDNDKVAVLRKQVESGQIKLQVGRKRARGRTLHIRVS
jgi:hypothetical protein